MPNSSPWSFPTVSRLISKDRQHAETISKQQDIQIMLHDFSAHKFGQISELTQK